jgi:purine catabolism regulator
VLRLLGLPGIVAELADGATAVLLSLARDQDASVLTANFAARVRSESGRTVMAAADARTAWDDVPAGLREAQHVADAVADSSAVLDLPAVVRLKDVHLRGLIRLLRDDPHVQAFAERELDGLLCGAGEDLLAVLRTYLATGRNKSRTAQLHHVSRPALYRRLEAIQRRLGVDLDDFEQAASVHIALLAHDAQQG